ncbi:MAG: TonB-dependent siderophore receptor [Lysobacter sp.]
MLSHYLRLRTAPSYNNLPVEGSLLPNPNGRLSPKVFTGEESFNHFDQDQYMLGYLLEHRIGERYTLRQNARYGHLKLSYLSAQGEGAFVTLNPDAPSDPANFRRVKRSIFGSTETASLFAIDNQVQGRWTFGRWQHLALLGADYQRANYDVVARNDGRISDIDLFAPVHNDDISVSAPFLDGTSRLVQTGVYVQDQIKFDERWVATLSGRYDHARTDNRDRAGSQSTSQSDYKFTQRAGLVYLASSGWAPYVSYATSFSPSSSIDPATGRAFKPETGRQYEAGLRFQPSGRTGSFSAAVFDLRRQNYVTTNPVSNLPKQSGEIAVKGLEVEATLQPIVGMNLTAAWTWTPKAEIVASDNPAEIGRQSSPVPKQQLSLWGDYLFANGFKVGLGARYVGANHGYDESAPVPVPGYTLFDAMAGYDFKPWSLAVNARNLTDKAAISTCSYGSCYYGDPRTVVATATYRW